MPVAKAGATIDDTTYDNPPDFGHPGKMRTLVFDGDGEVIFALAKQGDPYPLFIFGIEAGGGGWVAIGDGSVDPYAKGAYIGQTNVGAEGTNVYILGPNGMELDAGISQELKLTAGLPGSDPGVPGQLYQVAGVVKISL